MRAKLSKTYFKNYNNFPYKLELLVKITDILCMIDNSLTRKICKVLLKSSVSPNK